MCAPLGMDDIVSTMMRANAQGSLYDQQFGYFFAFSDNDRQARLIRERSWFQRQGSEGDNSFGIPQPLSRKQKSRRCDCDAMSQGSFARV